MAGNDSAREEHAGGRRKVAADGISARLPCVGPAGASGVPITLDRDIREICGRPRPPLHPVDGDPAEAVRGVPQGRPADPEEEGGAGALADRIAEWIAARVREAGRRGVVVGLSGGIDSSVTAALCRRALGDDVLGVIMPCESARQDEEDAALVAARLGLTTVTVRLDEAFRALRAVLPQGDALAAANLKPRLRMAVLYYHANMLSYLVAGTGNRTELMVGYFTKFGDGGADILPIGGIYKTRVRVLARELGIPERIVKKPPSAGLWEGQTDEGELKITYPELDRALEALDTGRTESVPADRMAWVRDMVAGSAHKRAGPKAFEAEE